MPSGIYQRKPHSEETKQKIRLAHLGVKSKFPAWNKGKKDFGFGVNKENIYKGASWNKGLKGYRSGIGTRPNIMPKGEAHWSYTGGKQRNRQSLYNPEYVEWRMSVFKRDNFKCKILDENCKGGLQAHHILRWADFPELRYKVNNGITLCIFHHPRKKQEENKLSPYFKDLISK